MNLPDLPGWQGRRTASPWTLVPMLGPDGKLVQPGQAPEARRPETEEERLRRNGWKRKRGEWLAPAGPTSAMNQILRSALGIKTQGKGDHRAQLGPALPPAIHDRRREERRERKDKKRRKQEREEELLEKRRKERTVEDQEKRRRRIAIEEAIAIDTSSESDSEAEKRRKKKRRKLEKIIKDRKKLKKKIRDKE